MKRAFLVACITLAVGCFTANAENEKPSRTAEETELNSKGSIVYYGERVGIFRPCKGELVAICKKITTVVSEAERMEKSTEYVKISDGVNSIIVEKSRVNFSDGTIK